MVYLHITEYSNLIKHRVPERKESEFDLFIDDNIIRTSVSSKKEQIRESYYTDSVIEEKILPLDSVIIFDDMDIIDKDQKLAYVYVCPICKTVYITTNPKFDFCERCESSIFLPEVFALINLEQMEDIAVNYDTISDYIKIKDDKIIFKDMRKEGE